MKLIRREEEREKGKKYLSSLVKSRGPVKIRATSGKNLGGRRSNNFSKKFLSPQKYRMEANVTLRILAPMNSLQIIRANLNSET